MGKTISLMVMQLFAVSANRFLWFVGMMMSSTIAVAIGQLLYVLWSKSKKERD